MDDNNRPNCLSIKNSIWYFFNFYGIEILRNRNWKKFIFNDCTIVNRSQLLEYIDSISSHADFLGHYITTPSVIIVQKKVNLEKLDSDQKGELSAQAKKRSEEVASLLFFVFCYLTRFHYGVSLQQQLYNSRGVLPLSINSVLSLSFAMGYEKDEHEILSPKNSYSFSIQKLMSILNKNIFRSLTQCIIKPNKNNKHLVNALRHFYITLNTPSFYSQFLGSMTAIEILLKSDNYDVTERKVKSMVGEEFYKKYFLISPQKSLFKIRHALIHEGMEFDKHLTLKMISIASRIILCYSKLLENLETRENVNNYIDIINKEKLLYASGVKISFANLEKFEKLQNGHKLSIDPDLMILLAKYFINGVTIDNFNKSFVLMTYVYSRVKRIDIRTAFGITKEYCIHINPKNNYKWFISNYQLHRTELEENFNKEISWINYTYDTNFTFTS